MIKRNVHEWACVRVAAFKFVYHWLLLSRLVCHQTSLPPAHGRVGRVMDCSRVRGLGFKSPGSILTSRTGTRSLSRMVRDRGDPFSVPVSG